MIHKKLKAGRAVMKFAVPFANFPSNHSQPYEGNMYGEGLRHLRTLSHFTYDRPPQAHQHLHFAIVVESRKSRSTGDSFPAFMAPFFKALGFQVVPIRHPKAFLRELKHKDTRSTPAEVYADLEERVYHYRQMPFAYDLSYVDKMHELLEEKKEALQQYGAGRTYNWNYQVGQLFYQHLFADETAMRQGAYTPNPRVHLLHEASIRRKASTPSYFSRPHFVYEMPQIQVIGARFVLLSQELYDFLDVPEEVSKVIESEVPEETMRNMRRFFSMPVSFHDLSAYFIGHLICSTIRFSDVLAQSACDTEDQFYSAFVKTIKRFYLVSNLNGYNEKLRSNENNGKRQPTNVFYHFNRSFGSFFTPTSRPIHFLETSK